MGYRRRSRELALQALYYMDVRRDYSLQALGLFQQSQNPAAGSRPFFLELVHGVLANRQNVDAIIGRYSSNWKLERMSAVDRNVMRVAVYELLYCEDIPAKVSINEAIDIAKDYGTDESGAFINGILDTIRLSLDEDRLTVPDKIGLEEKALSESGEGEPLALDEPVAPTRLVPVTGRRGIVKRRATPESKSTEPT